MENILLKIKEYFYNTKKVIRSYIEFIVKKLRSFNYNINSDFLLKAFIPFFIIGIGFYSCSFLHRSIRNNINDIFIISDDIRAHFSNKPDYWGLSSSYIIEKSIIDKKFINKDKIFLADGKEIIIGKGAEGNIVLPRTMSFDVVLKKLNKSQCISYLEAKLNNTHQVNLESITIINSNNRVVFSWGDKSNSLPVKSYTGKDICLDENNTIIWSIR